MLPPLRQLFAGRELLVTGATGFVGKVFLEILLRTHPEIARVHVLVRAADAEGAAARLREEILDSPPLRALAEALGPRAFARAAARLEPVAGDLASPGLGHSPARRAALASRLDAVVHVAGLVDFTAPLDRAFAVNTLGVAHVLDLVAEAARRPRRRPLALVHVSTCYVAGDRAGTVPEELALDWCPRAGRPECAHFRVAAELADCERTIARREEESRDAARRAAFSRSARAALAARGRGDAGEKLLAAEVERQRRRWVAGRLREDGLRRARRWGWPNTYTYTKSLGEQLVAEHLGLAARASSPARRGRGQPAVNAAVVRPAVVESALAEPFPGWNQGINTSAPLIYLAERGHRFYPAVRDLVLDVIPVDLVAHGLVLVLAACLAGRQEAVYQLATGAENPFTMARLIELTGLSRARRAAAGPPGAGSPLVRFLAEKIPPAEPVPVHERFYRLLSAPALARIGEGMDALLGALAGEGGGPGVARRLGEKARQLGALGRRVDRAMALYRPYVWELRYRFLAGHVRALRPELRPADRKLHPYAPEEIDWRRYWMEVHLPGVRRWSLPRIEGAVGDGAGGARRTQASGGPAPEPPWRTLGEVVDAAVARHGHAVALRRVAAGSPVSVVTYAELGEAVGCVRGALLAAGVRPGDRVAIVAENSPEWVAAFFGIVTAGAIAVPIDPGLEPRAAAELLRRADVKVVVGDARADRLPELPVTHLDLDSLLRETAGAGALVLVSPRDLAAIVFTSGTAGGPKGVRLSHRSLLSLVAALAPLFPLAPGDSLVSCLPLHHSFELTCGLLLPLGRGAAVTYISPVDGTQLARAIRVAPPAALVGVPALWQLLARRIRQEAAARGRLAGGAFDALVAACAGVRREVGINVGRAVFDRVHRGLGGRLRYLISGAATLPPAVEEFFSGLGFDLYEGYGLTEAAPVLAVNRPGEASVPGSVGRPVPGVTIRIRDPDREGVGEILARGPNIMDGYEGDPEATARALRGGWLATGDLGRLDGRGRLAVVGRLKDVIVTAGGENVYPDELEALYGTHPLVGEIAVVGVDRGRGEEVGCVIVPVTGAPREEAERQLRAHVAAVGARLPGAKRITCLRFHDGELPRTATRKVRREAVRALLAGGGTPPFGRQPRRAGDGGGAEVEPWLRSLLAGIAGVGEEVVTAGALLAEDLGLDSLARVELAARLGERTGRQIAPEAVAGAQTVREVAEIAAGGPPVAPATAAAASAAARRPVARSPLLPPEPRLPAPVAALGRRLVGAGQEVLYRGLLASRVRGREHIPWDRAVLVVANHASHLDAGLVRHALGAYGRELRTLAARDYFFDTPAKRFLAASFTNLVPFDRGADFVASLAEAAGLLRRGHVVLAFPEGTRSPTGRIGEFRAGVGYLALAAGVDVLPVRLLGTERVLPKGSFLPRGRTVEARIGPLIPIARLREIAGEQSAAGYRRAAAALREAVVALGEEGRGSAAALAAAVESLSARFRPGVAQGPVTYYLALGERARFTVRLGPERCEVVLGRAAERADCVLKTSPRLFLELVEDGRVPSAAAVTAGELRTNDPELLGLFQRAFGL